LRNETQDETKATTTKYLTLQMPQTTSATRYLKWHCISQQQYWRPSQSFYLWISRHVY